MSLDDDDEILRLRVPTALQVVMALDIAIGVLLTAFVILMGLFVASWGGGLGRGMLPLAVMLVYACGCVWISVQLGRASPVARAAQVVWSVLLILAVLWLSFDSGLWGLSWLFAALALFLLVAPALNLVLLFTPAVRAFFATVRAHR